MSSFYVFVHQKGKQPRLRDEYATEEEAKAALRRMTEEVHEKMHGPVVSPSGSISFMAEDFAGAEYHREDGPIVM